MIGILFHGPEIFDSGWAARIIDAMAAVDGLRCVLAGTMGRTAAIDSGLPGIECPGMQPSRILRDLEGAVDTVVFANFAKSEQSGLTHGLLIAGKSGISMPLVQIECAGNCYVEWIEGSRPAIIEALAEMGFRRRARIGRECTLREESGRIYRRITTAAAGEFLLVDGIVIGTAKGGDITLACEDRQLVTVQGADVKPHGLEKLARLGGIDLKTAKVATAASLRRTVHVPRVSRTSGKGVVFVDHAGMHLYDLIQEREGAVTIGDDTTAVVGDALYRFQIPLIGITDGDRDKVLGDTFLAPGSTIYLVPADDSAGLRIHAEIFHNRLIIEDGFDSVRERISALLAGEIILRRDV